LIEVHELVKRYGGRIAVDHLSFTVEKGQVYGFLGPNGAGKSTTMNLMTGCLGLTEGEIRIAGHSVLTEPDEARRHIGYLPEQPPLYPDMTVREYLHFAAGLKQVPRAQRSEQVARVCDMTMLEDVGERLIQNLSKGYRQRVGLAQALIGFPEILILDEPTVGLDPKQIIAIRSLIRRLSQEHTVLLSSHILSEIQAVCSRILIIHHGKKVAEGTPEELERQLAGNAGIHLLVKGTMEDARAALEGLPGLARLTDAGASPDGQQVTLTPEQGVDLREEIFHACVRADLPLLMMRPDALSLEDVFLKLTTDPADVSEGGAAE